MSTKLTKLSEVINFLSVSDGITDKEIKLMSNQENKHINKICNASDKAKESINCYGIIEY